MIEASTVSVKTMADDTLRLTIDIDPRYAQEAFSLFGSRGVSCVVARLTQEAAQKAAQSEAAATAAEKPKGGDLAKLAGQFCANPDFWEFIDLASGHEATEWVRRVCGVQSRAEIDHNEVAKLLFHDKVRRPFADWCRARGIA